MAVFQITDWARDEKGDLAFEWDCDEGRPSVYEITAMSSLWITLQNDARGYTVAEVAKVLNLAPAKLAEAIQLANCPYTFLSQDNNLDYESVTIELDGE